LQTFKKNLPKKSLTAQGERSIFYWHLSFVAGYIHHHHPAFHLRDHSRRVDGAKEPGDSGVSSAFWEIFTTKSGPLNGIRAFAGGFLTLKMEG
jgi:hypothetical protein